MEAETLNALNIDIINKSQLDKFTTVTNVKQLTHEAKYLDYIKKGISTVHTPYESLSLEVFSKFIILATYRTSLSVTREQIEGLEKDMGIDLYPLVNDVLTNEASQMLFKAFKARVSELATQTYLENYTKIDKLKVKYYQFFKKKYKKVTKIKSKDDLVKLIVRASHEIMRNTRRGPATFVICNTQTAMLLSDCPYFVFSKSEGINHGQPYELGTVAGLKVYVDPYMEFTDTTILIGRKPTVDEPGVHAFYFGDGTKIENVIIDETLASKVILTIRLAIAPLGFYPQKHYTKIVYKPTKKMLK